jgi:hypothetical protein
LSLLLTYIVFLELILEASKIVDDILERARERIAQMKEEDRLKMASCDTGKNSRPTQNQI